MPMCFPPLSLQTSRDQKCHLLGPHYLPSQAAPGSQKLSSLSLFSSKTGPVVGGWPVSRDLGGAETGPVKGSLLCPCKGTESGLGFRSVFKGDQLAEVKAVSDAKERGA